MCAVSRTSLLFEAVFPALCPACDGPLPGAQKGLCSRCQGQLLALAGRKCPACGRPVVGMEEWCLDCLKSPMGSQGGVVWGEYQGVLRRSILALKHGGHDEILPILALRLAGAVCSVEWFSELDLVTGVPSHPWHHLKRGYCTAEVLARDVARLLDLQYSPILRRRGIGRQARRSRTQRMVLSRKSFSLRRRARVEGLGILVIDDVTTTGATMRRLMSLLTSAGAGKVFSAALAWSAPAGSWG